MSKDAFKTLFNRLLPPRCYLCQCKLNVSDSTQMPLCPSCDAALPRIDTGCGVCNTPLASGSICGDCQRRPPIWQVCYSAFAYESPITQALHQFKYQDGVIWGRLLGRLIAEHICLHHEGPLPELLVPVPMHHKRLAERGLNHTLILTQTISKELGIPYRQILKKTRWSAPQTGQKQQERQRQLRGSFTLREKPKVKHIALIDDVVTTGATSNETAKLLKKSGIYTIEVWCLART